MVWVGMSRSRFVGGRNVKVPSKLSLSVQSLPFYSYGLPVLNISTFIIPLALSMYPFRNIIPLHLLFFLYYSSTQLFLLPLSIFLFSSLYSLFYFVSLLCLWCRHLSTVISSKILCSILPEFRGILHTEFRECKT
jgi:hypothetical protein